MPIFSVFSLVPLPEHRGCDDDGRGNVDAPTRANFMNASSNALATESVWPRVPRSVPEWSRHFARTGGDGSAERGTNQRPAARRGRAMPYDRHRRRGCKVALAIDSPGMAVRASSRSPPGPLVRRQARGRPLRSRLDGEHSAPAALAATRSRPSAWSTWSDRPASRISTAWPPSAGRRCTRSGPGSLDAADLLRQLVYLPNASLLVAEARRELVGGALLVLRPSVIAGGYVGTIDFLVVAPGPRRGSRDRMRSWRSCCALRATRVARRSRRRSPPIPRTSPASSAPGSPQPGQRSGDPSRRPVRPPAAPSAPGGRKARTAPRHRSHSGQERRRLRGRGEHLLRGQGGRRGHRLRHAAQVGHRRTRFRPRVRLHRARPGQREPAQLPPVPRATPVQGRQQGHPQVRRRQGQGEPRHRARRRPHEDRAQPRHRRDRVRRRRLRLRDPRRPGDGRPRRGHQLPRQHVVRPDRGRRPVHRHHPDRQGRQELHPVGPPGRRATTRTCR